MTKLRPAKLAAACSLILVTISPVSAQTAISTNFTTNGSDSATSSMAAVSGVSNSTSENGAPRNLHFHRRARRHASSSRRISHALTSRGVISSAAEVSSVVGRLAVVTTDNTSIRAGRDRYNRILSTVPKGQYLAINTENATQYGVLMIDHTIGYVAKADVQLLDYQVVTNTSLSAPQDPAAADGSQASGGGSGTLGQQLVETAYTYLGVPYVWGGNTQNGIDCSGFVKAVYGRFGIDLPRHSGDQAAVGYDVPRDNVSAWVPGDRMYFACHHPEIDHTGMYIGDGRFIHASASHNHQVAIDQVDNPYFYRHLVAVRRSKELLGEPASVASQQQSASAQPYSSAQPSPSAANTTVASSALPSSSATPGPAPAHSPGDAEATQQ